MVSSRPTLRARFQTLAIPTGGEGGGEVDVGQQKFVWNNKCIATAERNSTSPSEALRRTPWSMSFHTCTWPRTVYTLSACGWSAHQLEVLTKIEHKIIKTRRSGVGHGAIAQQAQSEISLAHFHWNPEETRIRIGAGILRYHDLNYGNLNPARMHGPGHSEGYKYKSTFWFLTRPKLDIGEDTVSTLCQQHAFQIC